MLSGFWVKLVDKQKTWQQQQQHGRMRKSAFPLRYRDTVPFRFSEAFKVNFSLEKARCSNIATKFVEYNHSV